MVGAGCHLPGARGFSPGLPVARSGALTFPWPCRLLCRLCRSSTPLPEVPVLCGHWRVGGSRRGGEVTCEEWKAIPPRLTIDPSPWRSAKRPFTSTISPARLQRQSSTAREGCQSPPLRRGRRQGWRVGHWRGKCPLPSWGSLVCCDVLSRGSQKVYSCALFFGTCQMWLQVVVLRFSQPRKGDCASSPSVGGSPKASAVPHHPPRAPEAPAGQRDAPTLD